MALSATNLSTKGVLMLGADLAQKKLKKVSTGATLEEYQLSESDNLRFNWLVKFV